MNNREYTELVLHGTDWYKDTPERACADVALYVLSRKDLSGPLRTLAEDIERHFSAKQTGADLPEPRMNADERREVLSHVLSDTLSWPAVARLILCYGNSLL